MRRLEKIVYCVLNTVTNKSYIGWCTDFNERKSRHIREAELGSKSKFYNALRKYGEDSFEWSIIFDNLKSCDECKQMEQRLIALFDTYNNGYNSTKGGDGGFTGHNNGEFKKGIKPWNTGKKLSDEYREKLRIAQTGKKHSQEHITKQAAKMLGHTVSEETRQKIALKKNNKNYCSI